MILQKEYFYSIFCFSLWNTKNKPKGKEEAFH